MAQSLMVGLLVLVSAAYALWTLAPQAVRRSLARGLLRVPLPVLLRGRLLAASQNQTGCGCSGCDRAGAVPAASGAEVQTITLHRRVGKR